MDYLNERQSVIDAGLRLVAEGLIARTWGNLSLRLNENLCAITPSGRTYADLNPEDIVIMKIDDLSYEGVIVPSSEKALHALAYRMDASIKAVVHTHQLMASCVAAARRSLNVADSSLASSLGGNQIRCGAYALPGTQKLARASVQALKGRKAALMANHGAVCVGANLEEAFTVASALESACEKFIAAEYERRHGQPCDIASRFAAYLKDSGV